MDVFLLFVRTEIKDGRERKEDVGDAWARVRCARYVVTVLEKLLPGADGKRCKLISCRCNNSRELVLKPGLVLLAINPCLSRLMLGVSERQSTVSRSSYFHKIGEDLRYASRLSIWWPARKRQKSRSEESCAFAAPLPAIYHRKKGNRRRDEKVWVNLRDIFTHRGFNLLILKDWRGEDSL